MIAWFSYLVLVSVLLALAARAFEGLALLYGRPARWGWAGALGATVLVPVVVLLTRRNAPPAAVEADWLAQLAHGVLPSVPSGTAARSDVLDLLASPIAVRVAAAVWLIGSIVVVLGLVVANVRLRRERRQWRTARLCGTPVLVAPGSGPAVLGVLHPAIVVPEWLASADSGMQRLVLLHESEHLRAGDQRLQFAGCVALALMPWNPVMWATLFRLRAAIEVDCDRRVLAHGTHFGEYGDVLLRVAGRPSLLAFATAFVQPRSLIERRIRAMTRRLPRFRTGRAAVLACAAIGFVVLACGTRAPAGRPAGAIGARGLATVAPRPMVVIERAITETERQSIERATRSATRNEQPLKEPPARLAERPAQAAAGLPDPKATVAGGAAALRTDVIARTVRRRRPDRADAPSIALRRDGPVTLSIGGSATGAGASAAESPLLVVDGVILSRTLTPERLPLRPEDIESIEVIKGAAAARMYGTRAAGGVISITTKRGRG